MRRAAPALVLLAAFLFGVGWMAAGKKWNRERGPDAAPAAMADPGHSSKTSPAAGLPAGMPDPAQQAAVFDPDTIYASAGFEPVPAWLPRPRDARNVRVNAATLRSDGLQEGEIAYTLPSGPEQALAWAGTALGGAGLHLEAAGSLQYASPGTGRRCAASVEAAAGSTILTLTYSATDHQSGCACPTCEGSASSSAPSVSP